MTKLSHGGSRPGAGRPKKTATLVEPIQADLLPLAHLLGIMRDPANSPAKRMHAPALLLPYMPPKFGAAGVKDARQAAAGAAAASGKFATPTAPKLATVHPLRDNGN